jgi:hypothetical protein
MSLNIDSRFIKPKYLCHLVYLALVGEKTFQPLYLQSQKHSSRIRWRLVHFPLDHHPPYEALYYEWKTYEGFTKISYGSSTT